MLKRRKLLTCRLYLLFMQRSCINCFLINTNGIFLHCFVCFENSILNFTGISTFVELSSSFNKTQYRWNIFMIFVERLDNIAYLSYCTIKKKKKKRRKEEKIELFEKWYSIGLEFWKKYDASDKNLKSIKKSEHFAFSILEFFFSKLSSSLLKKKICIYCKSCDLKKRKVEQEVIFNAYLFRYRCRMIIW